MFCSGPFATVMFPKNVERDCIAVSRSEGVHWSASLANTNAKWYVIHETNRGECELCAVQQSNKYQLVGAVQIVICESGVTFHTPRMVWLVKIYCVTMQVLGKAYICIVKMCSEQRVQFAIWCIVLQYINWNWNNILLVYTEYIDIHFNDKHLSNLNKTVNKNVIDHIGYACTGKCT